jgi:hypothetical protein
MTKRIYCDNHLPSALRDCPRCIEEKNKKLQAVVGAAVDRARQAERLIAHAISFMSKEQVGHWQGVRAWQEDDTMDRALDGEVKP